MSGLKTRSETSPAQSGAALSCSVDMYNGVLVQSNAVNDNVNDFEADLHQSLATWRSESRRGVWLRLSLAHAQRGHVQVASNAGFTFHSATSDTLVMTHWLPSDEPSTLPRGPHTSVGVGVFVTHPTDANRVLVVKERVGFRNFKIPTGLVEGGEDIDSAAQREVREETGVETAAESARICAFRSQHGALNLTGEATNLFFVVALRATSERIRLQESELVDAQWISIDRFRRLIGHGVYGALHAAALDVALDAEHRAGLVPRDMPVVFAPVTNRVSLPPTSIATLPRASL
jgi:8-oxo-dGTP pyrophosphatase MutT (NUDIX family)